MDGDAMSDTVRMAATAAIQAALIVITIALLAWAAVEWRRILRKKW